MRIPKTQNMQLCFLGVLCLNLATSSGAVDGEEPKDPKDAPEKQSIHKEDLAEKLVRQATGHDEGDVMERILALMDRSGRRLVETNDGGAETQSVQNEIVSELDKAIEKALAERKPQSKPQKSQSSTDKRNLSGQQDKSQPAQAAADESGPPGQAIRPTETVEGDSQRSKLLGDLGESRRSWGNLPARDREELIQGADQEILERYRSVIERYYRTLAEAEDES